MTDIITAIIAGSLFLFGYLVKDYVLRRQQDREGKRISFDKALSLHSDTFFALHIKRESSPAPNENQLEASRQVILWGSDEVVYHFANYFATLSPETFEAPKPHEIHFGNAVLAFRRNELRKKNKRLTPKHIIILFKAGWREHLP